ncbi:MAG TPA: FAD:protein FMN transferase [Verrucomicrobiae bacterium]|nr:FAD:protein FMN transferase [Verrucomicrobiae bacterium]
MKLCSTTDIRRCRPLLGTLVEVAAWHADPARAHVAVDAAFAQIECVQRLMGFHDPRSEVSHLNQFAARRAMHVSAETWRVLQAACELHKCTGGVFDVAVAPELMRWGLLPRHLFGRADVDGDGRTSDIVLLPHQRVQFSRPLLIDLGGLAKGFAVDCAVEALQASGITAGLVNAGGDLRCFGEREQQIWVRHPKICGLLVALPELKNGALATSANSYQRWRRRGRTICAHIHGWTRLPCLRSFSVSVRARTCLIADALTKVVLALGEAASAVLKEYSAISYIVPADGRMTCCGEGAA